MIRRAHERLVYPRVDCRMCHFVVMRNSFLTDRHIPNDIIIILTAVISSLFTLLSKSSTAVRNRIRNNNEIIALSYRMKLHCVTFKKTILTLKFSICLTKGSY